MKKSENKIFIFIFIKYGILLSFLFVCFISLSENSYAFTRSIDGSVCTFSPEYTGFWDDVLCGETATFCSDITSGSTCVPPLTNDQQVCRVSTGTKDCVWLPLPSTVCDGVMFLQSRDGTSMQMWAEGTKDCSSVTCTSFNYSDWGTCVSGTQTRTVLTSSPDGCTGGIPITSQSCCSSYDHTQCYSNDLYWYDSCNVRETKETECGSSYCDIGGDIELYCSGGNVWGTYDYRNRGCSGIACTSSWNYNSCGDKLIQICSGSTDCGYGTCTGTQRPTSWSCSGNACNYTCSEDSSCIPPLAVIDSPAIGTSINSGDSVNLAGSGTDDGGSPITIQDSMWYLSNNCSGTALTSSNPFNLNNIINDITISLQVQDTNGAWSTNCPSRTISINSCQGSLDPSSILNALSWGADEETDLISNPTFWGYAETEDPLVKCEFKCDVNYSWNPGTSTCDPDPINGACGDRARTYLYIEVAYDGVWCFFGNEDSTPLFPDAENSSTWICEGEHGGVDSSICEAIHAPEAPPVRNLKWQEVSP